jgi:antitoxin VapB
MKKATWHMLWHMPDGDHAMETRKVSLFRNGRSQAVRIPRGMEFTGTQVVMRKEGNRVIIEPTEPKDLIAWLKTLEPLDEDFPEIDDPPPRDVVI